MLPTPTASTVSRGTRWMSSQKSSETTRNESTCRTTEKPSASRRRPLHRRRCCCCRRRHAPLGQGTRSRCARRGTRGIRRWAPRGGGRGRGSRAPPRRCRTTPCLRAAAWETLPAEAARAAGCRGGRATPSAAMSCGDTERAPRRGVSQPAGPGARSAHAPSVHHVQSPALREERDVQAAWHHCHRHHAVAGSLSQPPRRVRLCRRQGNSLGAASQTTPPFLEGTGEWPATGPRTASGFSVAFTSSTTITPALFVEMSTSISDASPSSGWGGPWGQVRPHAHVAAAVDAHLYRLHRVHAHQVGAL